jgi:hypothetical protein
MLEHSVLAKTGQLWKVWTALAGVVVGGVALLYGVGINVRGGGDGWLALAGMLLVFGSLGFASASVSCPKCGARWVWMAVSQRDSHEYGTWLISLSSCPRCQAS